MRNVQKILIGKPEDKRSEDLDIDGRIILEWIFEWRLVAGSCEHGNESSSSTKGG
jgi:hypothetical protein